MSNNYAIGSSTPDYINIYVHFYRKLNYYIRKHDATALQKLIATVTPAAADPTVTVVATVREPN